MTASTGWHRFLIARTRGGRRRLVVGLLLLAAQTLVVVALPWPTKLAVDFVLVDRALPGWMDWLTRFPSADTSAGLLVYLAMLMVLLASLNAVLAVRYRVWRRSTGIRLTHELAEFTLDRVQRQSLVALDHSRARTGDLVQRIVGDTKSIDTLVFGVWFTLVQSLLTLVLLGGVIALMTGGLAGVALLVAVPMLVATRVFRDRLETDAASLAGAQGQVSAGVTEMLTTLTEVQAFAAEDAELARFRQDLDTQFAAAMTYQRSSLGFGLATSSVTAIGTGVVMYLGGVQVIDGSLTIGELLVFLAYLAAIYAPVEGLSYVTQSLATARAGASRIMELSATDRALPEPDDPAPIPTTGRGMQVSFTDVDLSYRLGEHALHDVTLEIPAGEWVAVLGESGAGKTTLTSVIPRLHDVQRGSVRLNGVDVRDARLHDVRRSVALARQDPLLLPLSVRENIRYGSPDASDATVEAAADAALCMRFVHELPYGFETVIGESGATLSGGQRQRLAIARALCRDAPILILDEPTAALDASTELQLMENLRRAAQGRTVIVVTHRMSTVQHVDRVLVLADGRVVESGSPDVLARSGGVYQSYLTIQPPAV